MRCPLTAINALPQSGKAGFMIFFPLLFCLLLGSCGLIAHIKRNKLIESKGFDPRKDTVIFRPYQYYIKYKNYVPIYRELNPAHRLDLKINIRGFENTDSIPIGKLFEEMQVRLSDSSYNVENGELYFSRSGYGSILKLGAKYTDTCLCRVSFDHFKTRQRIKKDGDVLFFWNVTVRKDDMLYTIPARYYHIQ